MAKKISHPYPHVGAALSPHTDAARPYPLSLSLSQSLSVSLSQVHAEANAEHEVGVALDGVAEGWVAVERKVALPPPPRRAVRGIRLLHQVSSSGARDPAPPSGPPSSTASSCSSKLPLLLGAPPFLSLPPLIFVLVHCTRCRVPWHADNGGLKWRWCSAVSSGNNDGSSLKRDGGGARWWQGVRGGRGDEAPLLEAIEALPLLPSPRRPHCSNCETVETLPLLNGGLRRSGNSVYLNGRR
jgi:hypothetical protein